ncbi:hypothetical protein OEZ85_002128 [Tetradesmus obliquus]|uniref:Right handed beta helix domain-containing protein n=1 Tax=Tetradesmus obliquus TaxID=3088 RepID=A0ABY8U2A9_TETOB|nr:hypothetical protein OEZ85_002128 [Tetradesmus obliquus]
MNTAGAVQGGGQASITIHSSTFGSNTMNKWDDIPAGILTFYDNSTASVSWSNFRRNTARFDVAIALYGSAQANITSCVFDHNTATKKGGTLSAYDTSQVYLNSCEFSSNKGGAVALDADAAATISSCTFTANEADDSGAALYAGGSSSVNVTLTKLINNSAAFSGGEVAPIPDTCEPCLPGFYSLDPAAAVCSGCPGGAECPGGAAMVPLPGWWHSAATSAQMHR